jgi:predicted GNAT family N-acyltransferase
MPLCGVPFKGTARNMDDWRIEPLGRTHKRDEFACGKSPLDDFIRARASQYEKRHLGRTYVAVRAGDHRVLGYYTIASSSLSFEELPPKASKKLPKHPVPVIPLARLAVDQTTRGQRLGEKLLIDALSRSLELSQSLGVHAVEVDAIDPDAKAFYEHYGFTCLPGQALHLYVTIETIRTLFRKAE